MFLLSQAIYIGLGGKNIETNTKYTEMPESLVEDGLFPKLN